MSHIEIKYYKHEQIKDFNKQRKEKLVEVDFPLIKLKEASVN